MSKEIKTDPYRATGRTTRAVILAIQNMLRGNKVVFVTATQHTAHKAYRQAKTWLEENGWFAQESYCRLFTLRDKDLAIEFGGGRLDFRNMDKQVGMPHEVAVIEDHVVTELRANAARIKARRAFLERLAGELYRYDIRSIDVSAESSNITAVTYDGATIVI